MGTKFTAFGQFEIGTGLPVGPQRLPRPDYIDCAIRCLESVKPTPEELDIAVKAGLAAIMAHRLKDFGAGI